MKVRVGNMFDIDVEVATVRSRRLGKYIYGHINKHVPNSWIGDDVVIIRKRDFEKLQKLIDVLINDLTTFYKYLNVGKRYEELMLRRMGIDEKSGTIRVKL